MLHRNTSPVLSHKQGIARSFSRAATDYDRHAAFQRACGETLQGLLGPQRDQQLLDAGCGTGWFSRNWQAQGNRVIALDLSTAMLERARLQASAAVYLVGDIEHLPLACGAVDLAFSNLAVQWCDDLPRALAEFHRVLRPGGRLAISTLAQGSLSELEQAWRQVDDGVHMNRFLSQAAIGAAFAPYRHRLVTERRTLHYHQLSGLLREIKGVGAGYLHQGRTPGLTSRSRLRALDAAWPREPAGLPLSYQLVYGVLYRD